MPNTKMVAFLVIATLSSTAVAASAQEIPKSEQRETVVGLPANRPAENAVQELAESSPSAASVLPDAPIAAAKLSAFRSIAIAVPQQPGNPSPRANYSNPNRRKYILLGVICAAAIAGAIVIATARD
ncbi:MAG TPA: hypothetical protein VNY74_14400 [Edaphobacter sp.]|jgi:hypothetical protein|nr:hypothetical protein [Edaphobacter sp.]